MKPGMKNCSLFEAWMRWIFPHFSPHVRIVVKSELARTSTLSISHPECFAGREKKGHTDEYP